LYIAAGLCFALSRLPRFAPQFRSLLAIALIFGVIAVVWHGISLRNTILLPDGITLSLGNTASFIGLLLGLTALTISFRPMLRGLASGMLILAAVAAVFTGWAAAPPANTALTWQIEAHILISLFAYGLLTVGAIVAVYAVVQDQRLRTGRLSPVNQLFAPLETNERLLYGIAAGGFLALLLAVFSGFVFVDDLFAQHLAHKTALSLLALLLFGILLAGRQFAGWRGRRAVSLYLWGFVTLGLAYFGSRYILEQLLGRTWT
jgi:ABC-type uncharacterized transport system permease subunit